MQMHQKLELLLRTSEKGTMNYEAMGGRNTFEFSDSRRMKL